MTDTHENQGTIVPPDTDAPEPMSMTLSGIGRRDDPLAEEEAYESASGGNGLLTHSTLLIVAVAIVAAGSLYLMRATQGDLSNSDEAQQIEAKIANTLNRLNKPSLLSQDDPLRAKNLNALLAPTHEVTAIFEHDVRDQQVPIDQVKKDPFALAVVDRGGQVDPNQNNRSNSRRTEKLRGELSGLTLQSIMLGTRNLAVISGEFYKRGDRLGSFTINRIEKFTVYLQADSDLFELSLKTQIR